MGVLRPLYRRVEGADGREHRQCLIAVLFVPHAESSWRPAVGLTWGDVEVVCLGLLADCWCGIVAPDGVWGCGEGICPGCDLLYVAGHTLKCLASAAGLLSLPRCACP